MCSVTKVFLDKLSVLPSLRGILEGLTRISEGHGSSLPARFVKVRV